MKKILYAFRFLTILPIPWKQDEDLTQVARSTIFFPFVGLAMGLILALVEFIFRASVSPLMVSAIITSLWILFTGGLHLDGLSDLADGLGGRNIEDRLRIMKDSRIGAFGAISLIAIILLKVIFLRELLLTEHSTALLLPLILAPIWAKNMVLIAVRFFQSARPDGMGNFLKVEMKEIDWIVPLVLSTAITIYILSMSSVLLIPFILIMILVTISISKKLNGLTGDCYGAIGELSELLFLFLSILLWK